MSIKIVIVDDESLVRLGMESIIEWNRYGYSIIGEAGNGVQGLEMIMELNPDIVLADIMMPQMDGLEMIKEAKSRGFKGKFIILSCISEFEYLQKAIRMGVSRYILKSAVKPMEILETVNEISDELNKNRVFGEDFGEKYAGLNENFAMNEFLNLSFKGIIANSDEIAKKMRIFGFSSEQNTCIQAYMVREEDAQRGMLYKIAAVGKSLLEEVVGSCFVNYEDYLILIFQYSNPQICDDISFRFCTSVKQYFGTKLVTASAVMKKNDYCFHESYVQLRQELRRNYFGKAVQTDTREGVIPSAEFSSYEKLHSAFEVIKGMMVQSNSISEQRAKEVYAGAVEYLLMLYELDAAEICKGPADSISAYLESFDSFDSMYYALLDIVKNCYKTAGDKGYTQYNDELTDNIIKYVHGHCLTKITAKDVAEYVHFSSDYVCKYFKKKTQVGLSDYILKLKIHKSKQDLLFGDNISQVADKYSFSSVSHYLKTFKRYEGMTPGSYVRQNTHD